jgi:hypothetical protein
VAGDGSAVPMGASAAHCAELSRLGGLTYGSSQPVGFQNSATGVDLVF